MIDSFHSTKGFCLVRHWCSIEIVTSILIQWMTNFLHSEKRLCSDTFDYHDHAEKKDIDWGDEMHILQNFSEG